MADVSRVPAGDGDGSDRDDRSRGQVILVAGLAVAVTLVALVLLLNTVIYTQNLATRGPAVEDGEAVAFRTETKAGVAQVIDAENREEYDSLALVGTNVADAVARFDRLSSRYAAGRGTIADVEEDSLSRTNGWLLRQNSSSTEDSDLRDFSPVGDDAPTNWTLAEDVGDGQEPGVRNATFTVSREHLSDDYSSGFSVRLRSYADVDDGGTDEWRVYIYKRSDAITLAVKNGTESVNPDVCSVTGPEATIDLTAGTINGSTCPGLVWAKGTSTPYDIEFWNPSQAAGNYSMTVATPTGAATDVRTDNFADSGTESSPRAVPAVYSATFEIHFETPDLEFHTTVRAARGEPE